jgi:TRAP-type C4-dicarboxylate transport system permease small subunit
MFDRLSERLVQGLLVVAALTAFALSFLVTADVVGRVVFNTPVKGTPEIVSMSIVIICFLLAAQAVRSGSMLSADVLVDVFGAPARRFSAIASGILGAGFFILIVWGTLEPLQHAWMSGEYEGEGALRVPVWPARLVILLGAALVIAIYVGQAVSAIMGHRDEQRPPSH